MSIFEQLRAVVIYYGHLVVSALQSSFDLFENVDALFLSNSRAV